MTFIARLNVNNEDFQDYFLLPNLSGRTRWTLTLMDEGLQLGEHVVRLSDFINAAGRVSERPSTRTP